MRSLSVTPTESYQRLACWVAVFSLWAVAIPAVAENRVRLKHSARSPVTDETLRAIEHTGLRQLSVSSNQVTDEGLVVIGGFEGLESLSLHRVAISDNGLRQLAKLKHLSSLQLTGCPQLTDAGLKRIGSSLGTLRKLTFTGELQGRSLPDLTGLASLRELQLSFDEDWAGSIQLDALAKLSELSSLKLSGARLGGDAMKQIVGMAKLRFLSLAQCRLTPVAWQVLGECDNLRGLHLRSVTMTDAELSRVASLTTLQYLTLYNASVTAKGISKLAALNELTFLNLSNSTKVNDELIEVVKAWTQLKELHIDGTSVSESGGRKLRAAMQGTLIEHAVSRAR